MVQKTFYNRLYSLEAFWKKTLFLKKYLISHKYEMKAGWLDTLNITHECHDIYRIEILFEFPLYFVFEYFQQYVNAFFYQLFKK